MCNLLYDPFFYIFISNTDYILSSKSINIGAPTSTDSMEQPEAATIQKQRSKQTRDQNKRKTHFPVSTCAWIGREQDVQMYPSLQCRTLFHHRRVPLRLLTSSRVRHLQKYQHPDGCMKSATNVNTGSPQPISITSHQKLHKRSHQPCSIPYVQPKRTQLNNKHKLLNKNHRNSCHGSSPYLATISYTCRPEGMAKTQGLSGLHGNC